MISVSVISLGLPDDTILQVNILKDGTAINASEYTVTGNTLAENGAKINIELIVDMNAQEYSIQILSEDYQLSDSTDIINRVIVIENTPVYIEQGQTMQLSYFTIPNTITDDDLIFESEDETIATIEPGGMITAVGKGETTITISTLDGTLEGNCTVSVFGYEITIDELTTTPDPLQLGEEGQINVKISTVDIVDAQQLDIKITKNGIDYTENFIIQGNIVEDNEVNLVIIPNVEEISSGTYTVSVSYNGKEISEANIEKQTRTFSVQSDVPVTGITVETTEINAEVGNTFVINPTIAPENATNQKLIWTSSNEEVAMVNENGEITTVGNGEAVITISADENSEIKATINVIVQEKLYTEEYLLDTEAKTISHIPENTTLEAFLNNVSIGVDGYEILNNEQEELSDEDFIGTGATLKIANEVYTIIVTGDTNGDGQITITDVSQVKLHFIGLEQMDEISQKAGDTNGDGQITITDVSQIKLHFIGLEYIRQ